MIASVIHVIRTTGCMRTRQSSHEIVVDCSDEGGHQYQPLDRFILREYSRRIKTSLVVGKFISVLRVMTYFVFYKLFWD